MLHFGSDNVASVVLRNAVVDTYFLDGITFGEYPRVMIYCGSVSSSSLALGLTPAGKTVTDQFFFLWFWDVPPALLFSISLVMCLSACLSALEIKFFFFLVVLEIKLFNFDRCPFCLINGISIIASQSTEARAAFRRNPLNLF
ncbi:hypothetical protein K450DRAFT_237873 [Umbelopsis ramanniana AG]|uniref:Uncharacterized protein n=1 Tax=Umbelopsis ramanniana AG TaxID=1314678 RepID=A0AAD5ECA6_UMBRA|nr:uncharacterized protein K450DRAFT_237873 [Umbelopsis ramanniana AG]KAI8580310.1 hypothetical protein K450DRAFT_237873 [Umbelopsis ramanniana AG]